MTHPHLTAQDVAAATARPTARSTPDPGAGRGTPALGGNAGWRPFLRHYLEMVVVMVVGMVALAPVWPLALAPLGWSAVLGRAEVAVMVMAVNMVVAMTAWMRYRGHGWASTAEMAVAMALPFIALLVPLRLGAVTEMGVMGAGHVLMLVTMAAAMLRRREEYSRSHGGRR